MNTVSVWLSGSIRVTMGDTIDNMDFHGVGVFDGKLSPDDRKLAREVHRQLCETVDAGIKSNVIPSPTDGRYSVDCLRDGKLEIHHGITSQLPEMLIKSILGLYVRGRNDYLAESRTVVRLDAEVVNVEQEKGRFLVSIRFVNGGQYPIAMDTPDKWSKVMGYQLDFGGKNEDGTSTWGASLAGLPLINQSEFPDGRVVIPAKGSVTFRFLTLPDEKFKRGTYKFNVVVNAAVTAREVAPSMGRVDFHSDTGRRVPITLDRDWPSTPREMEEFEAMQREKLSSHPVYPGATFAEDGYYRAVSGSTQRSRFVKAFRAGERAPDMAGVLDERGEAIYGRHPGWFWEADLDAAARSQPGEVCPRSGRWFARIESPLYVWPPTYEDDLNEVILCRQGDLLPPSRRANEWARDQVRWEWIGV
ncbi:hypothetical protein [Burkholderia ubonensis]|nr:hypothetical protein [Burkholderia ubonensis]